MKDAQSFGPLSGLRVLDLTRMLAGPFCTMILADLGADVVKIESPAGDTTRAKGPFRDPDGNEPFGGYFQSVNRNKRSVVLDLALGPERERFLRLVDSADIVVENFRPGVMERWGLSYEDLALRNPRLVYAAIRGFGDPRSGKSPYADWPAYDVVAQAMGGFIGITGHPDQPVKAGPGVGDVFPAALTAVGVLAAIHERGSSGRGQFVDVAMYDAVLMLCERIVHQFSYSGVVPGPAGNGHPLLCPFDVFRCADGAVAIAAPSENHWVHLAAAIGRSDLAASHHDHTRRLEDSDMIRSVVATWSATKTRAQIVDALGGTVPVGPVNTVADIFRDDHVRMRDMLVSVNQPGIDDVVTIVGPAIKLSRTPARVARRAPLLGEHTAEILGSETSPD